MGPRITTGGTLAMSAAVYKSAIGVLVAGSAAIGWPMTGETAADVVTLAIAGVGVWLHSKTATAGAVQTPAKEGVSQ